MKQKFCYHGIGENLLRYESIMNNGIVSESEGTKIEGFSVNSSGHYNGKDNISVAIPHDDNYGALRVYILDGGISFYIKDVDYILAGNKAIIDSVIGIILPNAGFPITEQFLIDFDCVLELIIIPAILSFFILL